MAGSLRVEVRPGQYRDSIVLMVASARMSAAPGVEAAMAAMATPLNLDLLRESGLWSAALERAGPGDLVLAARGADPESGLRVAEAVLSERAATPPAGDVPAPRTVRTASRLLDGANIAVVSVPGEHAAWACWDALAQGLNVFCFSDHVSVADEVRLKDEALRRGLLMLGPDCGTAILDGVGLGFSNLVPRGRIGVVGASGTGIQQLTCLLAQQGVGISQAIGVGGRDLTPEVGGYSGWNGNWYRGPFRIFASNPQGLTLVNQVGLEDYLRSVRQGRRRRRRPERAQAAAAGPRPDGASGGGRRRLAAAGPCAAGLGRPGRRHLQRRHLARRSDFDLGRRPALLGGGLWG